MWPLAITNVAAYKRRMRTARWRKEVEAVSMKWWGLSMLLLAACPGKDLQKTPSQRVQSEDAGVRATKPERMDRPSAADAAIDAAEPEEPEHDAAVPDAPAADAGVAAPGGKHPKPNADDAGATSAGRTAPPEMHDAGPSAPVMTDAGPASLDCEPLGAAVVIVNNLAIKTTSQDVRAAFEKAGAHVQRVGLNYNVAPVLVDGQNAARVDVCTRDEAVKLANQLQGLTLDGRTISIGVADPMPQKAWSCAGYYDVKRSDRSRADHVHIQYVSNLFGDGHVKSDGSVDSQDYQLHSAETSRDYHEGVDGAYGIAPATVKDYADANAVFILSADRNAAQPSLLVNYSHAVNGAPTLTELQAASAPSCNVYTLTDAFPTDPVVTMMPPMMGPGDMPVENCTSPSAAPCDDSDACNGRSVCDPSDPAANARGCVAVSPAVTCAAPLHCDANSGACTACDGLKDADLDGYASVACGGSDCDDTDAHRNPGSAEYCDGYDNDCDGVIDGHLADVTCTPPSGGTATCSAGACRQTCNDATQIVVDGKCVAPVTSAYPPNKLTVAVYRPRQLKTCFIGDPCTEGKCSGLYDDNDQPVALFTPETYAAVNTSSPRIASAKKSVCLNMQLSDTDLTQIEAELETFRQNARTWTDGDIELTLRYIDLDSVDIDMTRYGGGVWVTADQMEGLITSRLDFVPDANILVVPERDAQLGWHPGVDACGLTGGEIAGAGWSWMPKKSGTPGCASADVMMHEWLHQVESSYRNYSNFHDGYGQVYPACGMNLLEPHAWFPGPHDWPQDPDYAWCGKMGDPQDVYEHILRAHWDPAVEYFANHCKNGRQDADETAVDTGSNCITR